VSQINIHYVLLNVSLLNAAQRDLLQSHSYLMFF